MFTCIPTQIANHVVSTTGQIVLRLLFALVTALTVAEVSGQTVINFDDFAASSNGTVFPGNTYAASGVSFTSGLIPNSVAIGNTINLTEPADELFLIGNQNSISLPNFAASTNIFVNVGDILMTFSSPITSVQLTTDDAFPDPNGGDIVRLLAVVPTGVPHQYVVLGLDEGLDNAVSAPDNLLSVSLGGASFSHAIFQATTEPEGFDDLTFVTATTLACDFNQDTNCDIDDLQEMLDEGPISPGVPVTPGQNQQYDLNTDGVIDPADRDIWLRDAATANGLGSPYKQGDANLDGAVDGQDFIDWNGSKFSSSLLWQSGDFNSDGFIDGADFILWNNSKFTGSDAAQNVPEPASMLLVFCCLLLARRGRISKIGQGAVDPNHRYFE